MNSKSPLTCWYHSEKWEEKREEIETNVLSCVTAHWGEPEMRTGEVSLDLQIQSF